MRIIVYFLLLTLATGLAFIRGTAVEKGLATTLVVGNLATMAIVHFDSSGHYSSVSQWYFLTDVLLALSLCAIAMRWPTWASIMIAAFQVNGMLAHVVKMVSPETFAISYAMLVKIWGWLMVAVLLLTRFKPKLRQPLSGQRWPYFSRVRVGRTTVSG